MSVLAEAGFSTAIFGPAWTHEHFSTSAGRAASTAECVEQAMWLGKLLPSDLGCDCHERQPHQTHEYVGAPIVDHAREFPAGSAHFFETDFGSAFQRVANSGGHVSPHSPSRTIHYAILIQKSEQCIRSMLGSQGPLPHLLPMPVPAWEQAANRPSTRVLYGELLDEHPGGLLVNTKIIGTDEKTTRFESWSINTPRGRHCRLCLFKLNTLADGSLAATIRFKYLEASKDVASGFYLGYSTPDFEKTCYMPIKICFPYLNQVQEKTIVLSFPNANARLVEFGVYGPAMIEDPKPLALCLISNLTIKPRNQAEPSWTIDGVRMERGRLPDHDRRLAWKWSGLSNSHPTYIPWSKRTGPFSYFDVMFGGRELGRAYCMKFPIRSEDFDECKGEGVEVIIRGRLFGGGEIASLPMLLWGDEVGVL